jgi:hypothetical protein
MKNLSGKKEYMDWNRYRRNEEMEEWINGETLRNE